MKKFWDHFLDKPDDLLYRAAPRFIMEIMRKYFRLQVEGAEHLPKRGAAIIASNHSGYSGFDALMLAYEAFKATGRSPKVLTHHFWFLTETTAIPAKKLGFIEASMKNGLAQLTKKNMILIFPEGEKGNFKPSKNAYQLQEFKRGFVRMALKTGAPIIPTMVIGAEETHINLKQLKLSGLLRGTILPLPLNVLPLPAKWRIRFLPPMHLPYEPKSAENTRLVHELAEEIQETVQENILKAIQERDSVFF